MTDVEKLRLYRAAARNARKLNRTLQTNSEKLERWLDRAVVRKARIDWDKAGLVEPLYKATEDALWALQKALADMISVAGV